MKLTKKKLQGIKSRYLKATDGNGFTVHKLAKFGAMRTECLLQWYTDYGDFRSVQIPLDTANFVKNANDDIRLLLDHISELEAMMEMEKMNDE